MWIRHERRLRLETANDLLRKLEHDFERMRAAPGDAYAAFDFFVTAEHLSEWTRPPCTELRKSTPLLAVVSHLANNSKHFEVTSKRHYQVEKTSASYASWFSDSFFGAKYFAAGWWGGKLGVDLTADTAASLKLPKKISALDLAERVLQFWKARLWTGKPD